MNPIQMESLEVRIQMAVTAAYLPFAQSLTVFGDSLNNNIAISRDAAGKILVNGGAVPIIGGTPTVANTALISVFGLGGNDNISLNEANGALPAALLFGGDGNDTLTGGSGADQLFGQSGNDQLLGKAGNDFLFGGDGGDILTGGVGDDQVFGQSGNDRMIWNPGEGTDLNEGGDGIDTVEINGGNGAEQFTVTPNGTRVRFDRINPAPFSIDIGTSENLVVNMNGGDDSFVASNGLATLISLTVDGGAGNDSITGGDGNDMLLGGDGNDLVIGGRGNDTELLGAGDDTSVWNPGDGSDVVEGQVGADTLQFNGANIAEKIDISANGSRVRFTRDIASITMDLNGTERINFTALGGVDSINVGDLSGTGVTDVSLDLANPPGSGTGDASVDTVTVNGTSAADNIQVVGAGSAYDVVGLPATVHVTGSEATDFLVIQSQGGNDTVSAIALPTGIAKLTLDGGTGNDILTGSQGDDLLLGGDGSDLVNGGRGNDTALLGNDNDTFVWNPGDGSDVVEGQAGFDTMVFNGANINENIDLSANGTRLRLFRDIANITMDTNGVEQVNLAALSGNDVVTVNDLTGTGVTIVNINLAATGGAADGLADSVIVNGTAGNDSITVAGAVSGGVRVGGLPAVVNISGQDVTLDQLTVNGQAGADTIDASALNAGLINLTENGGDGDDLIVGSKGDDLVIGGRGNDTELMGAGDDTSVWNPGDGSDIVEGQAGSDTLQFNGANIAEKIDLSANGSRLRFSRDVAAITMDVNGTERVNFAALGGADQINVGDLSGTDVTEVNLDLGATGGAGGDGAADTVIVNGTNGDDVAQVNGDATGVNVSGLFSVVNIQNAEAANDTLSVQLHDGDDVLVGQGLAAGTIKLTADGGDGDDVLIGSAGNDVLTGGNGDDILVGNGGQDVLDGGPGGNVILP